MEYDNQIIKKVTQLIESHPDGTGKKRGEYSKTEVEQVKSVVKSLLEYEKKNHLDSSDNQLEWFLFLVEITGGDNARAGSIGKLILIKWSKKSKNSYALAYKIGFKHGYIDGSRNTQNRLETRRSKKLSEAAIKGHSENRAMKQEVFTWLDTNMPQFKSMDDAATAITGKVAPIKWRTARDWVGAWKKIRSAGTP